MKILISLLLGVWLTACGQSGALYLPPKASTPLPETQEKPASQPDKDPATTAKPTPTSTDTP